MKQFLIDEKQTSLLSYYIAVCLNPVFNIRSLPQNICAVNTPYFREGIEVIRKYLHLKGFPNISSKMAYGNLLEKYPPTIQQKYQFNNWKNIWNNVSFRYIPIQTRDILFKFLHGILPNKVRLKQIRIAVSDNCDHCKVPETNKHMVYQCLEIVEVKNFFLRLLEYCGFSNINMNHLIILDIPKMGKHCKNTTILLTSLYISSIWYGRSNKTGILRSLKYNIIREKTILEEILRNKFTDVFTEPFHLLNREIMERI